ncbi:MAG: M20/M25/M40 family metallo-hydrolase, partial [Erysipelotrichaceae bacterium]
KGDYKSIVLEKIKEYAYTGYTELRGNNTYISITGKPGHASRPEHGENASIYLLRILNEILDDKFIKEIYNVFYDSYGKGAGIYDNNKLTLNLGIININNSQAEMYVDCRYPYGTDSAYLTEKLKSKLHSFNIELPYDDEPTMVEDTDPYVKALKKAYEDVTHEECTSEISGGVSYSKVFKHCVAFGCVGRNSLMMAHQKDETILKSDLYQALEIYYKSLINFLEI